MSYKDYIKAIEIIEQNKSKVKKFAEEKIYLQKNEAIDKIESVLGIKFPRSYRDFLKRFGVLEISNEGAYSLDFSGDYNNIVCVNIDDHKTNHKLNFPETFVPIYDLGNGEKYCLDTAQMNEEGECPVVGWYYGRMEILYEDFGEFFLDVVELEFSTYENGTC